MDILVCVKQVPDDNVEIHLAVDVPGTANVDKITNAFDTYALELAARYTEANGGEVTAATIGDKDTESMMKNLLAVGAKKAYIFSDAVLEAGDEASTTAKLAQMVEKAQAEAGTTYGLILCGKESSDEISGQIGARLAEKLGVPFVSSVIEVEPVGDKLVVKQETEEGYIKYEVTTPVVCSIAKPNYDPRYPNIKAKMAARKAVIPVIEGIENAPSYVKNVGYAEPAKRAAGTKIQEKEAADAVSKAMAQLLADKAL